MGIVLETIQAAAMMTAREADTTLAPALQAWKIAGDIAVSLLWALIAVVALLRFAPGINVLLRDVGSRVSKVSAFNVELELTDLGALIPSAATLAQVRDMPVFPPGPSGRAALNGSSIRRSRATTFSSISARARAGLRRDCSSSARS